jgi:hypothetical protein
VGGRRWCVAAWGGGGGPPKVTFPGLQTSCILRMDVIRGPIQNCLHDVLHGHSWFTAVYKGHGQTLQHHETLYCPHFGKGWEPCMPHHGCHDTPLYWPGVGPVPYHFPHDTGVYILDPEPCFRLLPTTKIIFFPPSRNVGILSSWFYTILNRMTHLHIWEGRELSHDSTSYWERVGSHDISGTPGTSSC